MDNIYIFKTRFIEEQKMYLKKNKKIDVYNEKKFPFDMREDVFQHRELKIETLPELLMPEKNNTHSVENAVSLHKALKMLNPTQASDVRFWTYLAHVNYWDYMKKRFPIEKQPKNKQGEYILSHWHFDSLNSSNLTRHHGISSLWWGAHRTYDETRKNDPYELTRELFSMLDYTTHLISGTQGRNNDFFRAVLEFVTENKKLFSKYKESRIRYIMRTFNRTGGYKLFGGQGRVKIKNELAKLKKDIEMINI